MKDKLLYVLAFFGFSAVIVGMFLLLNYVR